MSDFLKKQTSSVDLENVDAETKKRFKHFAKLYRKNNGGKLANVTISSGRRGLEKTRKLAEERLTNPKWKLSQFSNIPGLKEDMKKWILRGNSPQNIQYSSTGGLSLIKQEIENNYGHLSENVRKKLISNITKVRREYGGMESKHIAEGENKGMKLDTPVSAFYGATKQERLANLEHFANYMKDVGGFKINLEKTAGLEGVLDLEIREGAAAYEKPIIQSAPKKKPLPLPMKRDEWGLLPGQTDFLDDETTSMAPSELEQRNKENENKSYDNLSFKDAFNQAWKDKKEGATFMWKGNPILLKKA